MEIKVPRRRWRKFCYRIVMHKAFEFFIYTVIILSIPPILVEFIHPPPPRSILIYLLKSISLLLFFIYLIEFILKICALSFIYLKDGFKAYFK